MSTSHVPSSISAAIAAVLTIGVIVAPVLAGGGGTVIRVPDDWPTIQDAINAASNGDEVVVATGTYNETINFLGKAITVRGDSGDPADTIIDGGNSGINAVVCALAEGPATRLIGVTVTNGSTGLTGGGLYVNLASPTIANCRFVSNSAVSGGAGIAVIGGNPTIVNCVFDGNSTPANGGGIYITSGNPIVDSCLFENNTAAVGGGLSVVIGSPQISDSAFVSNSAGLGGGLATDGGSTASIVGCGFYGNTGTGPSGRGGGLSNRSTVKVVNCVFSGNTANKGGAITNENASVPQMINCTFWSNSATASGGTVLAESANPVFVNCIVGNSTPDLFAQELAGFTTVAYSNIEGGWGGLGINNIDVDPKFFDPDGLDDLVGTIDDDLHLRFGSKVIDMGDDSSLPADTTDADNDMDVGEDLPLDMGGFDRIYGAAVDLGAFEFTPSGSAGDSGGDYFGFAMANAGDVDGDGTDDYIVGAPQRSSARGEVSVYSGATGALLWDRLGQATGDEFGRAVAAVDDLDMDGKSEVVVGAPYNDNGIGADAGRIYVYDGQTGALIFSRRGASPGDRFGWSVVGTADTNGDGTTDLIVGAPMNDAAGGNAGQVQIFSGVGGGLLTTLNGETAGDRFGWACAAVGDVDGDTSDDFVVAAPWHDAAGSNAGRIYVMRGGLYTSVYEVDGEAAGDRYGWAVTGLGRVDGDSFDDLAVGAPDHDRSGAVDAGRVYVLSGATGGRLFSRSDQAGSRFGVSVAAAGDVDCDGHADIVVGANRRDNSRGVDAGRVRLISGNTASTFDSFDGLAGADKLGRSVASLGDIDADGMVELLGGAPGAGTGSIGAVYILDTVVECAPSATWNGWPDPSLADLDGDGFVRGSDVLKALAALGASDSRLDFDADGVVSSWDLAFVLDHVGLSETDLD